MKLTLLPHSNPDLNFWELICEGTMEEYNTFQPIVSQHPLYSQYAISTYCYTDPGVSFIITFLSFDQDLALSFFSDLETLAYDHHLLS